MSTSLLLSVLLAALCLKVNAYQTYQGSIPNGDKVPNPCNRSTLWPGVGHQAMMGMGPRNPFGEHFAANNHVWNKTLCEKDSDGDGMTNGQELGDPNCVWMMGGGSPAVNTNLSHPGVCEPIGSTICSGKNSWLMNCMPGKFNCSAINASGVRNATLRFPLTPVPPKETTYICYQFKLPNDTMNDIIAITPILDNARILHHMLLYACNDEPMGTPVNTPFECGMGSAMSCRSMIGIWGVGDPGQCLNSLLGFRIGSGGFQYAILQLHWNNPEKTANLMDSSGMMIYYTNQLRPNRGQVAMIGQNYLVIPPNQSDVTFTGNCSSACSKRYPQSIYLTSATLHMHKLGKSGDIRLSRNGQLVQMLDNVTQYDYNTPTMSEFMNPIEVKPGDEISVKCVYDSTHKNSTTYYGEATSDEMCFGFFAYYPMLEDLGYCGQWGGINVCNEKGDVEFSPCDFTTLMKLFTILPYVCEDSCTSPSCALIMDGMHDTNCMNYPEVKSFMYVFMPRNHTSMMERCSMERAPQPLCPQSAVGGPPLASLATSFQGVSLGVCLVLTLVALAGCH